MNWIKSTFKIPAQKTPSEKQVVLMLLIVTFSCVAQFWFRGTLIPLLFLFSLWLTRILRPHWLVVGLKYLVVFVLILIQFFGFLGLALTYLIVLTPLSLFLRLKKKFDPMQTQFQKDLSSYRISSPPLRDQHMKDPY